MKKSPILASAAIVPSPLSQQISQYSGTGGVPSEIVHLHYDEYPQGSSWFFCTLYIRSSHARVGIAVSSTGRKFSNCARSLNPNNIAYTVAEVTGNDTETPYPSAAINSPPGVRFSIFGFPTVDQIFHVRRLFNEFRNVFLAPMNSLRQASKAWSSICSTAFGYSTVAVQQCEMERMYIPVSAAPTWLASISRTIPYPRQSCSRRTWRTLVNDIRFDLRPNVTASGQGVGYITDSSQEGRNGIIVVDLSTGKSWRHLDGTTYVHSETGSLPVIWGDTAYSLPNGPTMPISESSFGADGIALSADGETPYFSAVGSRYLYSVPIARLLDDGVTSELMAQQAVASHGQKGTSDGLETDSNGFIYGGNIEDHSIILCYSANGTVNVFARDGRMRFRWLRMVIFTLPRINCGGWLRYVLSRHR